jgi:hypothetical protein
MALNQGDDLAAIGAEQQITLPMTRHGAVVG